jgi:ISPg3, transposase (fragment)
MKLISKFTEICCIADDFCKEYELALHKKALSLSNPSINMEFRMEGEVEVKQLTLF